MIAILRTKYDRLSSMMTEKLKRHWAACEALALGRGGISAVSLATGLSRNTIRKGIREVQQELPQLSDEIGRSRVRGVGGGRKRVTVHDKTLIRDLETLLEATTRGDPECALMWTCKSTRTLAEELGKMGHSASHMTVDRLVRDLGYSLQANRKMQEGKQHPDRDAQFHFIASKVQSFQRRRQPVISVDTKKKELIGDFKRSGRQWRLQRKPVRVRDHDFRDKELGIGIPYGVYDVMRNEGWVSVGIDHDTAEFAEATIRRWWYRMGRRVYPQARELLITADAGGSNGYRSRLWKLCIQDLANATGLTIVVCHFPPGTSKWNKIEHRMFCHINESWRSHPLYSRAVIVNLIGNTKTRTGLKIKVELDERQYEKGIKISDEEFSHVRLRKNKFHGDWNYSIVPS